MDSDKPETQLPDKTNPSEKKELSYIDKLNNISQFARKVANWYDSDTEIDPLILKKIDVAYQYMTSVNKFLMDQMVDIGESINESNGVVTETKAIPTKPSLWAESKEISNNDSEKANIVYRQNGGKWRKKRLKKMKPNGRS